MDILRSNQMLYNNAPKNGHDKAYLLNSVIAILPFACCLTLPIIQIAGYVYLYDVLIVCAIAYLGAPKSERLRSASEPFLILAAAAIVSTMAGIFWTGITLRALQILIQMLLGLLYARMLLGNILAGKLSVPIMAGIVAMVTITQSIIMILQSVGYQFAPTLTAAIQRSYFEMSGYSVGFFENRYLAEVTTKGFARVMGTWDVPTTAAGMLSLTTLWLVYLDWSLRKKLLLLTMVFAALTVTGSRHSWVLHCVAVLVVSLADRRWGSMVARSLPIVFATVGIAIVMTALLSGTSDEYDDEDEITTQFASRMERTLSQGVADSSIQIRYVEGTQRFLTGMANNPSILLFGFGAATDKVLWEQLGPAVFPFEAEENAYWGFASNGWLLAPRNYGLLGLLGLILVVRSIYQRKMAQDRYFALFIILIILADNYAIETQRCMMLILATAAVYIGAARTLNHEKHT